MKYRYLGGSGLLVSIVGQGKVRYIGCSNLYAWQIVRGNSTAERMNIGKFICGQYLAEKPDHGTRFELAAIHELPRYWQERGFRIVEELGRVSAESGASEARLALAWLLRDHRVSAIIVGARNKAQLTETITAGDWDISDSAWERLNAVSSIDFGYPKQWMDIVVPSTFSDHENS
jgi:aryl-alcohol dehydrogenase-like predicted oxidoreductase